MILPYEEFFGIFEKCGFDISERMYTDFDLYARLLVEWNEKINLTAITDPQGISVKHFLDSLLITKYVDIPLNASIIDVGTGAGFPAVPLKIYRNDLSCTLLDSLNKRINFLSEVSEALGMPMDCVHARAEEGGRRQELREKFDFATARAVAALPALCEYCLPYVKVGGSFIALKGPNEDSKLAYTACKTMGGEISDTFIYELPNGDSRQLILIRKIKPTPDKYPRNAAQMSKKPL